MRCFQLALATTLAVVASVVIGAPVALAGGWAVTTLDELPSTIRAGETYSIGYTIRQHGQTPFNSAQSAIEIRLPNAATAARFAGRADGAPGHYVAQVRFPDSGEWEWSADQTPFARQPLGTITVLPAINGSDVALSPATTALRAGLPIATLLALGVFVWRVVLLFRAAHASAAARVAK